MRYAPPDVPWQRVVGAGGTLPIAKLSPEKQILQRDLLQKEGAVFVGDTGRVDMAGCQWLPQGEASDRLFGADDTTGA